MLMEIVCSVSVVTMIMPGGIVGVVMMVLVLMNVIVPAVGVVVHMVGMLAWMRLRHVRCVVGLARTTLSYAEFGC